MRKDFSTVPTVSFRRSRFDLGHDNKTSMNVGYLYPLDWQEVLPGDNFKTRVSAVARVTSSFIKPIMDNLRLEIAHFFVPYRLVFEDYERVFGNPNPSAYVDNDLAVIPSTHTKGLASGSNIVSQGSVGDYLGLPIGLYNGLDFSVLPFRAFALIYDKWFRNQNVVDEMYINKGETGVNEVPNKDEWSPNNYFGKLPKVRKKMDYFTSCLPAPQKGEAVGINAYRGIVPVRLTTPQDVEDLTYTEMYSNLSAGTVYAPGSVGDVPTVKSDVAITSSDLSLGVDLNDLNFADVNSLRMAFQMQKMLERDALGGSRYNEYLQAHFGVYSPDSRLQLPEYLGGGIIPINIQQVAQTSQGNEESPLANVAGYSLTNGYSKYSKGFTEHGIIMTVGFIRQYEHSYSQGVEKKWTRFERKDFYDPLFANIGEQPVYKRELFPVLDSDAIFGYNEAWSEYRYSPNKITGQMRPPALSYGYTNSLDIWHLGDIISPSDVAASELVISKDFVEESPVNIDRVLTVPSVSQDNFIVDLYFDTKAIRVMPIASVPGYIDHH